MTGTCRPAIGFIAGPIERGRSSPDGARIMTPVNLNFAALGHGGGRRLTFCLILVDY
jgi:hypothetical protein